jgi:hypothetical protein
VVANRARDLIAPGHLIGANPPKPPPHVTALRTDVHIAARCFRTDAKQRR